MKLPAQSCATEMGDVASVSAQLLTTNQSAVVLEIASRYGDQVIPALRKRAEPDRPIETPEGAAQAALAKLGDRTPALHELIRLGYKDELGRFNSIPGAARTALAMLGEDPSSKRSSKNSSPGIMSMLCSSCAI